MGDIAATEGVRGGGRVACGELTGVERPLQQSYSVGHVPTSERQPSEPELRASQSSGRGCFVSGGLVELGRPLLFTESQGNLGLEQIGAELFVGSLTCGQVLGAHIEPLCELVQDLQRRSACSCLDP